MCNFRDFKRNKIGPNSAVFIIGILGCNPILGALVLESKVLLAINFLHRAGIPTPHTRYFYPVTGDIGA